MKRNICLLFIILSIVSCKKTINVETEQVSVNKTFYLTEQCRDSLLLQFELEFPTMLDNTEVLHTIQNCLLTKFFGPTFSNLSLNNAIDAYIAFSQKEYLANNQAFAQKLNESEYDYSEGPILSEQQILTGRVYNVNDKILTYELEQYVYMGGAHGVNTRMFYNFCLQSGRLLAEDDIFTQGYQQPLTLLLQQSLVEQYDHFSSKQDFIDAGFDFDMVRPNGNFAFTDTTLIYVFNPYEIAPYSYGETEITLDVKLLKEWLKE